VKRPGGPTALLLAPVIVLALLAPPAAASPAPRDSTALSQKQPLLGLGDLQLAMFTGVSLAFLGQADEHLSDYAGQAQSGFADDLAKFGEHFGNPAYTLPILGVTWIAGHVTHHPGLSASCLRIAGGMVTAGVLSSGAKIVAGRYRPSESPDDPSHFDPFSGHESFPSGHTTMAFSLAAGLDRETRGPWVPCLAYSAATITAWSRVRDQQHWPTDVLAGAVLGVWASGKFDRVVRHEWNGRVAVEVGPMPDPSSGSLDLGATLRF
jgi:membrane-associated phospholipid phosphatase